MSKLPPKPTAIDGCNLRLYRMFVLASWLKEVEGASIRKLQAFMTLRFAMRRRTAQELAADMENARILKTNGVKFVLTPDGEKWLKEIAKEGGF